MSSEIAQKGWSKRELVGTGYLIGDAAMFANGMLKAMAYHRNAKEGAPEGYVGKNLTPQEWHAERNAAAREALTGLVWGIGGVAMAKYGNRPLEGQMEALEQRLATHFKESGLTLSEDILAKALKEKDKSFFAKIEDFCYRYPTEILNVVYGGMAAATLVWDGVKDFKQNHMGKSLGFKTDANTFQLKDISSLGMGITIVIGALCGLLIKEKSKEQLDEAGSTGFSRWIQEKPMRATGAFYFANNYFTYENMMGNKAEFQNEKNPLYKNMYLFRGATLGSYLFGNVTLMGTATGAQGVNEPTEAAKKSILETTAKVILAQPKTDQEKLINDTAEYLTHQRELGFSRHTQRRVAEMITADLQQYASKAAVKNDSWVAKTDAEMQPDVGHSV